MLFFLCTMKIRIIFEMQEDTKSFCFILYA